MAGTLECFRVQTLFGVSHTHLLDLRMRSRFIQNGEGGDRKEREVIEGRNYPQNTPNKFLATVLKKNRRLLAVFICLSLLNHSNWSTRV